MDANKLIYALDNEFNESIMENIISYIITLRRIHVYFLYS